MGINLEYGTFLHHLNANCGFEFKGSVIELGAQDISANPDSMHQHISKFKTLTRNKIELAHQLYEELGFSSYNSIDATGLHNSKILDLNNPLNDQGFNETFDLVTNIGTIEHCFDLSQALKNTHNLCKHNGVMIHQFPSSGNFNHGFYNLQPRLFFELARSNNYSILEFAFTVDYRPFLYRYSSSLYRKFDDRDLMCYVALKKNIDSGFRYPFDNYFNNKLENYNVSQDKINEDLNTSYIKSDWRNITTPDPQRISLSILEKTSQRRNFFKRCIDFIGNYEN